MPRFISFSAFCFMTTFVIGAVSTIARADLDLDQLSYKTTQESHRTANLRVDGFAVLAKGYAFAADVPLNHGWTLGPAVFHYPQSYNLYGFTADGVGLTAVNYLNGKAFRSGWYAGPLAYFVQSENYVPSLGLTPSGFQFGIRGGYQWVWSRFNVQAGATALYLTGLGDTVGSVRGDFNLGFVL